MTLDVNVRGSWLERRDGDPLAELVVHLAGDDRLGAFFGVPEFDRVFDGLLSLVNQALADDGWDHDYAQGWESVGRYEESGQVFLKARNGVHVDISEKTFEAAKLLDAFCDGQKRLGIACHPGFRGLRADDKRADEQTPRVASGGDAYAHSGSHGSSSKPAAIAEFLVAMKDMEAGQ